jgi:hypothetical protein
MTHTPHWSVQRQAADCLGVSERTLHRWRSAGLLKPGELPSAPARNSSAAETALRAGPATGRPPSSQEPCRPGAQPLVHGGVDPALRACAEESNGVLRLGLS